MDNFYSLHVSVQRAQQFPSGETTIRNLLADNALRFKYYQYDQLNSLHYGLNRAANPYNSVRNIKLSCFPYPFNITGVV